MTSEAALDIYLEGVDDKGQIQLGEMATLVIEGSLPPRIKPENCDLMITIGSSARNQEDSEAGFSMGVSDFMSGSGPFLCQVDFEAERVGGMSFAVDLMHGKKRLAQAATSLRIINPQRDASGNPRKQGKGVLKVKK